MDYDDRGLAAMPKLVGGPKYTRPPLTAAPRSERPPDPDDLPLASEWTPEEQALALELGLDLPAPAGAPSSALADAPSAESDGSAATRHTGTSTTAAGTATPEAPSRRRPGLGGLFRGPNGRSGVS